MDGEIFTFICPYELCGETHYPTIRARSADDAMAILQNLMPLAQLHRPYKRKALRERPAEDVGGLLERYR